ncbi:FAD-dependent oxidoreductase [Alcaligenaceae bacterium]|nr:FAD-dependent oxidoreductase [Alcaligenaceae bacterium]
MRIAVIGAGWAGLAAAVRAKQLGHTADVFEAGQVPGGRARRVWSRALDTHIDNGQHILLAAYTETLALMRELGLDPEALFYRERLTLQSADGHFSLSSLPLPAPFNLLGGVLLARGLAPAEKLRLIALCARLRQRNWLTTPSLTVAQWLAQGAQSPRVVQAFWRPLCVAALNTPPDEACAQLFANVLRDSVGGSTAASGVLIPRTDLSRLWPERAAQYLEFVEDSGEHIEHYPPSRLKLGHAVKRLYASTAGVEVDGVNYDAAIVATNTPSAHRLLSQLTPATGSAEYLEALSRFDFIPIATITFHVEQAWQLPHPMMLLREAPEQLEFGQWLFDRSMYARQTGATPASGNAEDTAPALLHVVISDARAMMAHAQEDVVSAVARQVQMQANKSGTRAPICGHHVIVEKRATFAARPGLTRPSNQSPWPRIAVAGDWTDTGYPGVLEGAVRSGRLAADKLIKNRLCAEV